MADDRARNGHDHVQTTATNNQRETKKQEDTEGGAGQDADKLLPEERCCFSAFQCLASPYLFGVFVCLLNFLQLAALAATGYYGLFSLLS